MDNWNKTELISHMDRLGCFNAENAESPTCKKLLGMLIPKNESDGSNNDDYSIVNNVVIASYSLAIFLNCALLWMIYKDSLNRFRTPSSLLIANLAISDLLGSCFNLAIVAEISEKAIILVLYPLTHNSLRRQRKLILTMNANNSTLRTNKLKVEKNFANTMFMVCFSLILFTSPYVVVFFFITTKCDSCILNHHFLNIWLYYRIFYAIHFSVNPVLYAWRLPCYRDSLVNLLLSPFKNRHEVRATRHPPAPKKSVDRARTSNENGLTLTASIDKPGIGMENLTVPQSETQT